MTQHLVKGAASNLAARILGLLASFLNVYLLGRALGASDFGVWIWLFSIFTLITAQDFGYISAMRVRIGRCVAKNDLDGILILYVSALLLTLLVVTTLIMAIPIYDLWIGRPTDETIYRNFAVICSAFTLIGTVSGQALLARLESATVGIVEALRSLIQIFIYLMAYAFDFSLKTIVCVFYLTTILYVPLVTKIYWSFANLSLKRVQLVVRDSFITMRKVSGSIIKEGALLWGVQIGMGMLMNSDVYLAGYFMPDTEVAKVGVVSRFQLLGVGLLAATLIPFSASFVIRIESFAKSTVLEKIRQAFGWFTLAGLSYVLVTYIWGSQLVMLWSTIEIDSPSVFVISGALFTLMLCVTLMQIFMQFSAFAAALIPWLLLVIMAKILLTASLVPAYGYLGVFIASAGAAVLFLVVTLVWLFKFSGFEKIVSGKSTNE